MITDSIQLAKFYVALEETRQRLYSEILPLGAHLQCADAEITQTLELARHEQGGLFAQLDAALIEEEEMV